MRRACIALLFSCSAPVVAPPMDSGFVEDAGVDGALVLEADSAQPRWLLFRFPNQSF